MTRLTMRNIFLQHLLTFVMLVNKNYCSYSFTVHQLMLSDTTFELNVLVNVEVNIN